MVARPIRHDLDKFCSQQWLKCEIAQYSNLNQYLRYNTSRSFPRSRLITGFVTRLTRRVSLMEQELLTLLEHMNSPPVFRGVRDTRFLVSYVCFVDRCLSFCLFPFGHCVVCSSSIYGIFKFSLHIKKKLNINSKIKYGYWEFVMH